MTLDSDWRTESRPHIKNFPEERLGWPLCRERPLLWRPKRSRVALIVGRKVQDVGIFLILPVGYFADLDASLHLNGLGRP